MRLRCVVADARDAPRARGDVVEAAGQQIFGLRFIPDPLPDRPVQHSASAGGETVLATLFELATGCQIFMMLVEGSDQVADSFTFGSDSVEHRGVP